MWYFTGNSQSLLAYSSNCLLCASSEGPRRGRPRRRMGWPPVLRSPVKRRLVCWNGSLGGFEDLGFLGFGDEETLVMDGLSLAPAVLDDLNVLPRVLWSALDEFMTRDDSLLGSLDLDFFFEDDLSLFLLTFLSLVLSMLFCGSSLPSEGVELICRPSVASMSSRKSVSSRRANSLSLFEVFEDSPDMMSVYARSHPFLYSSSRQC